MNNEAFYQPDSLTALLGLNGGMIVAAIIFLVFVTQTRSRRVF
ncbi:hypothetical protein [Rhizobium bangladeshense]|nr:hypothetical protein [Rhizobium bangladeshense]